MKELSVVRDGAAAAHMRQRPALRVEQDTPRDLGCQ